MLQQRRCAQCSVSSPSWDHVWRHTSSCTTSLPRVQVKAIQDKQAELEVQALKQQQLVKQQQADKSAAVQRALENVSTVRHNGFSW